jgi:hypothetical protein
MMIMQRASHFWFYYFAVSDFYFHRSSKHSREERFGAHNYKPLALGNITVYPAHNFPAGQLHPGTGQ